MYDFADPVVLRLPTVFNKLAEALEASELMPGRILAAMVDEPDLARRMAAELAGRYFARLPVPSREQLIEALKVLQAESEVRAERMRGVLKDRTTWGIGQTSLPPVAGGHGRLHP